MRDVGQLQLYRAQLASTEPFILGPRLRDQYVGHSVLTAEGKSLKGLNEETTQATESYCLSHVRSYSTDKDSHKVKSKINGIGKRALSTGSISRTGREQMIVNK